MLLYRKCHGDHHLWIYLVIKCSFSHNLTEATKQQTYLTKVVNEYALMMEMPCRPLNMESQNVQFVKTLLKPMHKRFI